MVVKSYLKYIFKDIKTLASKLIAIIMIVMLGIGFLVGLLTTAPNMRFSVERYYIDNNAADLVIQSATPLTESDIDNLKQRSEIKDVMPYFMIDEVIKIHDVNRMARIMLLNFNENIVVNQLKLIKGRLPNPNSEHVEVVVEQSQVYLVDIEIGYQTTVMNQVFEVVGIVQHPWYFAYVQEVSPLTQRPIETMIYTDESFLADKTYTHLAVTINNPHNYNLFSQEYKDYMENVVENLEQTYNSNFYYTTRNQNQSYVKFQNDVKIVEIIALIFPAFFFLITILVSMSSMTKIVSDQRIQIGTLRSLGYSKIKIMNKYIFYALMASLIGVLLGIGLGIYFIPAVIYNAYLNSYNLPELTIAGNFLMISIISIVMIVAVVLVTMISIGTTLNEKPANLMRLKPPKKGKKIFLERLTFIWKHLKFRYKSTFRNIFRNKRNLVLTLIGVAGSTALLLAGFGIKNSVDYSGDYQYKEMQLYDIEVTVIPNQINIVSLNDYEKIYLMDYTFKYKNDDYINVVSPENNLLINDFLNFKNTKRHEILMANDSVLVTQQFAIKHHIKSGDTIELEFQGIKTTFKVTEILDYYFGNHIYISKNLLEISYPINYNKIYVKTDLKDTLAIENLRHELNLDDNVLQTSFDSDIKAVFEKTSESINSIIIVLVVSASLLAIIINYNITLINISTRQKEIATLKVLGYSEREVSGYVFRETLIISSVAILLGLGLGKLLHWFIISRIFLDGVMFVNIIDWLSYLITIILSYAFLGFVYFISITKMRKIDMVEALKSYE
ncbi:MAG: FtsX-like permease family protein [Acholeplasmataceae bacterium]|nr:FtsX-like permease family protein [Acholeplasmataceae bacterium]